MHARASHDRGFSLIEVLTATAIAGIVLSWAVPSFQKVILDGRRSAALNDLLGSVYLARAESLKRSAYMTLCPSVDGATCSASSADWASGWLVYVNADRDSAAPEPDAGEPVVRRVINEQRDVRISSIGRRSFTFRPFQINSDNGTIAVCDPRGATSPSERRAVIVNTVGRPRISSRKSDGSPLDCS